jgi:phosphogluconate dehydratase
MTPLPKPHPVTAEVTARIVARSAPTRADYLARMDEAATQSPGRAKLSCANFAHAFAAQPEADKRSILSPTAPNIAIVTAYNDMLSAHQPYEDYPAQIRAAARQAGATAQVAGGVPAMCDGVTQGRPGMELSLFSRDVIAMSTAIALSHDAFDGALCLGICDKIVPGLVIGALAFGHLPTIFVPAGPMASGISNTEKARIRAQYAQGLCTREQLLASEMAAYHGPGTCTFYGTANSNQMMMEMMGLHLPGAAFVHPHTPLRAALTAQAAHTVATQGPGRQLYTPLSRVADERAFVNAIAGLLATGGSTNHTLHLLAMARAAGIHLTWDDISDLSAVTPLIARVYPNGGADVNGFHAAGGMALIIRELLAAGLAHNDVTTVAGPGLWRYTQEPALEGNQLAWRDGPAASLAPAVIRTIEQPFEPEGGIRLLAGNLGRAIAKTSAVKPRHRVIEAPAVVFDDQEDLVAAFQRGELNRDCVAVVRFQGPRANGMPELHNLSPSLGVLLDREYKVALVTDGRMSGASGKVPAALHVTPEALDGGPLAYLQSGDIIRVDTTTGALDVHVDPVILHARPRAHPTRASTQGCGRELFTHMRATVTPSDQGASFFH